MKNITVSLDEEIYRQARIKAAEQNSSVSALVRRFLVQLTTGESEAERRKRLQAETLAAIRVQQSFRAADRISRDELHDRDAIS
jgi:hypothetical protein